MELPSDLLHTPMNHKDSKVNMSLQEKLAEIMVKVDTKIYRKLVSTDSKRRMILYVEMKKAFCGILKSALLLYLKLVGELTISGFGLNPYEPCVMKCFWGRADDGCVSRG